MKKILIGLAVVVLIIAGGLFYVWQNLGSLIKTAVEEAGSRTTQVKVTLKDVDAGKVTEGALALRGLVVGNPSGFKTDSAFQLGEISVKVDPSTVTSDTIVIKEVVIAAPHVTYEFAGGGSNIGTIQKNVEKLAGGGSSASSSSSSEGGKKVIIENLYVRDGKVDVSADFLQGKTTGASLPTIHLKDIGKSGGGATPAQVAEQVIAAIGKSATTAVGKLDVGAIKDALGKELGARMGGVTDTLKQGTGGVQEGLKGILGK
ncbi:MAG: hypothetical protein GEU87_11050 [Alphaproteobacteria bacterium]|nr:hypothetical protein [Alphaproteobacteria bacterium]